MRTATRTVTVVLLLLWMGVAAPVAAQDETGAESWELIVEQEGEVVLAVRMQMEHDDRSVRAVSGEWKLRGHTEGSSIELEYVNPAGNVVATLDGTRVGEDYSGTGTWSSGLPFSWTASPEAPPPARPQIHVYSPRAFHRYFSGSTEPVLRIWPGDTVRTWSVDAYGVDAEGSRRSRGGNPVTGPFYVEGALPGDTLVVRLNRLRTTRDWAYSGATIVPSAVAPSYAARVETSSDFDRRWRIDVEQRTVSLANPTAALQDYRVPLRPMLGCIAVAPPGQEVVSTRDSGDFGGNLDYNRIRENTTLYLPVFQPGALLFLGDGHAAQGDGELTGDAVEAPMEIELTVDLVRGFTRRLPFAEDEEYWMAIGVGGSLDAALRRATTGMVVYLEREHGLTSNESALVMGFSVEYDVADLVGSQVSIVARLPRSVLLQLPPRKEPPF